MFRPPASLYAAMLAFMGGLCHAETLSCTLHAGQSTQVLIDSNVDDTNFQDPRGYLHHGASERALIHKLTLTNTGAVPLTGPLLIVNGRDWSSGEAMRKSLGLSSKQSEWIPRLLCFWRDAHSHAGGKCEIKKEPIALFNFWSYALCSDTTSAVSRLATSYGAQVRRIPLNGHVAAEYFYDGEWHIFDTDQHLFYLRLDNRTVASAADLRADPLLARRTKVFGRYASVDSAKMTFNTSLHEYIGPKEQKVVKLKSPEMTLRAETLYPGEQMIVHAAQAPEREVATGDLNRGADARSSTLRVVEWVINPAARRDASGQVVIATGYPILRVVNHTTGEAIVPATGELVFEIKLQRHAPTDHISVYCQRSRISLPLPGKGPNAVLLAAANPKGKAALDIDWEKPEAVTVPVATTALINNEPSFQIRVEPAADLLRWEVSPRPDFTMVPPNFDAVTEASQTLRFDPLTATFFNPGEDYFLRVKARHKGVWGEWSTPLSFRVNKPVRVAHTEALEKNGRLRLSWPDAGAGTEYLVFGSNRLDFLPEIFAAEEIVKLREDIIEETRPNKNLVATITTPAIDLDPSFRFYRVVARRDGVHSVPGDLVSTPASLAARLPAAQVLQTRWRLVDGGDEHLATEMSLP